MINNVPGVIRSYLETRRQSTCTDRTEEFQIQNQQFGSVVVTYAHTSCIPCRLSYMSN